MYDCFLFLRYILYKQVFLCTKYIVVGDCASIADVIHVICGIRDAFKVDVRMVNVEKIDISHAFKDYVKERMEMRMELFVADAHYLAFILDPRYNEHLLTAEEYEAGLRAFRLMCIGVNYKRMNLHLGQMQHRRRIFNDGRFKSGLKTDPRKSWMFIFGNPEYEMIAELALKLLMIPASSKAVESSFNQLRLNQWFIRNRIGAQVLDRLDFVRYNLRFE